MRNFAFIAAFLTIIAAGVLMPTQSSNAGDKFITIGTGGVTGVYYPAGGAICRLVNRGRKTHGIRCSVESTGGSIDNLNSLRKGEIEVAVAQSDMQFNAFKGTDYFTEQKPFNNMRSLFSLHSEPLTVVVRKDSGIAKFDDIKGKKVNIGNLGSGIRATMEVLMKQKNWTVKDFAGTTELRAAEQVAALCGKQIDVMIYAAGHPNGAIQEATTTCDTKIIPVDGPDIDKLVQQSPYYAYTVIPGGMYNGSPNDVKTIGVKATFVTTDALEDEVAYQLVKSVFENFENFKTFHPVFSTLDANRLVHEGNTAPLHKGAAKYFKEKKML